MGWLYGFAGAEAEDTESIAALALPVVGPAEGGPPTTDPAPPMPLPIPLGLPALPPLLAYGFETLPVPVPLPVGGLGLLPAAYGLDTLACVLDGLCCRGGSCCWRCWAASPTSEAEADPPPGPPSWWLLVVPLGPPLLLVVMPSPPQPPFLPPVTKLRISSRETRSSPHI